MTTLQERVHGVCPPKSWALSKLHRVLRVRKGHDNGGMKEDNLLSLSYGNIVSKDIEGAEGLLPENFETYQIVEPGNIILRLTDLQNDKRSLRQGLVRERGIITSAYDAIEVGSDHDPRFWAYALLALDLAKYYYSLGGGVRQSIKFADFPNDWIATPTIYAQKAIADFLDRETSRIDSLIVAKQKIIGLLTTQRRLIALQTFDRFLGPAMRSTADTFRTGHFSNGWSVRRVKQIVSFMTSGSRGWSDFIADEGELFLQSGNIGRAMGIHLESAQRVRPQTGAEADRTRLQSRDVLVCITGGRTGAVGFVGQIVEPTYINQHICLLRARSSIIEPRLLAHLLFSEIGQKQLDFFQYGLKQGLGFAQVGEIRIPIPPISAQADILQEIDGKWDRLDQLNDLLAISIERLRDFRAAVITSAVTGQIDVATWEKRGDIDRRLDKIRQAVSA